MYETLYTAMLDNKLRNMTVTSGLGVEKIISLSKEQTPEEIERTKEFSEDVVKLMKHIPNCSVAFDKFMTSYYHFFGQMCYASYYGFSELMELFEAIPSVIEMKGAGNDKMICLVNSLKYKILTERLITVIKLHPNEMVDITLLNKEYAQVHGYPLKPSDFGCKTVKLLLEKLQDSFKVISLSQRYYLCLIHHDDSLHEVSLNIRSILMEQPYGAMPIENACYLYQQRFGPQKNLITCFREMPDVIKHIPQL